MTTIAYDGDTIAADTQITAGFGRVERISKIYFANDGAAVFTAGDLVEGRTFLHWYNAGCPEDAEEMEEVSAMVVKPDGTVLAYGGDLFPVDVTDGPYAIGSGGKWAEGAMLAGKCAKDAVVIAAHFDAYTSAPIECWSMETLHDIAAAKAASTNSKTKRKRST